MSDLEKRIQSAADKLTDKINKGADYLTKLSNQLEEKSSTTSEKISSFSGTYNCPSCGSVIPDDATKTILTCPFCGATVTKQQTTADKVIGIIKDPIKQYQDRKAKEEEEAREIRRKMEEERKKHPIKHSLPLILMAVVVAAGIFFGVVMPHQKRVQALEALVIEIKQDIADGNFEIAKAKTNNVYLNDNVSSSENERWDHERETLLALIEAAQKDAD